MNKTACVILPTFLLKIYNQLEIMLVEIMLVVSFAVMLLALRLK